MLGKDDATALFRVFQETLTNVIRHAQTTWVGVRLQTVGDRLVLEVVDNGKGITEKQTKDPKAFGLIGMRERALAIKGKFAISGRPDGGTIVTVTLPSRIQRIIHDYQNLDRRRPSHCPCRVEANSFRCLRH